MKLRYYVAVLVVSLAALWGVLEYETRLPVVHAQSTTSIPIPSPITSCGTTVACAGTAAPGSKMVFGSAPLTSGTPSTAVLTGLPFSSNTSYFCTASDNTAASAIQITRSSGSSATLTGPATVTDVITYICMGS